RQQVGDDVFLLLLGQTILKGRHFCRATVDQFQDDIVGCLSAVGKPAVLDALKPRTNLHFLAVIVVTLIAVVEEHVLAARRVALRSFFFYLFGLLGVTIVGVSGKEPETENEQNRN